MDIYDEFQKAYDFYNEKLFDGILPDCIITIPRKKNVMGYYSEDRFIQNNLKNKKSEIALNPDYFGIRKIEETLSTLVHEMCHFSMAIKKNKCTKGYHDKKWSKEMERVGLIPTDDGTEKGKKTGFKMTHNIKKGGKFEIVTKELLKNNFNIKYYDSFHIKDINKKKEEKENKAKESFNGKRIKYSCGCSNVWGKKYLDLRCRKCGKRMKEIY